MTINATWVWIREDRPLGPTRAARFAREHGVRTARVSVPWDGTDESTLRMVAALRAEGLAVAALGGTADWAEHPHKAAEWAGRAMAGQVFDSVHLDIEPWTLPHWPTDADRLLTGTAAAVRLVSQATESRVEVDLAPHVAQTHPDGFAAEVRGAGHSP